MDIMLRWKQHFLWLCENSPNIVCTYLVIFFTFMVHDLVTDVAAVTVAARLKPISLHKTDESTYTK